MLNYLKGFALIYFLTYIVVNLAFPGKLKVGFISWFQLIKVHINLKSTSIHIGSVSIRVRPMYYLFQRKLKATHHDGLIIIHFYKLKVNIAAQKLSSSNISIPEVDSIRKSTISENGSNKKVSFLKKIVCKEKIVKILRKVRFVLPLTIVIHECSIINGKNSLELETFSFSFNCDVVQLPTEKALNNTAHLNLSNLHLNGRTMVKDLKWTLIASVPLTNLCSPRCSKLSSIFTGNGININLDALLIFTRDLKPENSNKSKSIANIRRKVSFKEKMEKAEKYLAKLDEIDFCFSANDTSVELKNLSLFVKNIVHSVTSAEKKDLTCSKYLNSKLYKLTFNFSSLRMLSSLFKQSKLNVEFFNFFSIWDLKAILFVINNIQNTEILKSYVHDDSFISRTFLTITNISVFTDLHDILYYKELQKVDKSINREVNLESEKKKLESSIIFENFSRLAHKLSLRSQILTTIININLSDTVSSHLLIDDILLDSSLTDNIASLFETDVDFSPTKSIFSTIRNTQLSITDDLQTNKVFAIDLIYHSVTIDVTDDVVSFNEVVFNVRHIEFLAENISTFKKLSTISTDIINKNKQPFKDIPTEINSTKNDFTGDSFSETNGVNEHGKCQLMERHTTFIPRFLHIIKFSINRITLKACFENPVRYWDGEDQSKLNNYKRGIAISFSEFAFSIDNTIDIPIADFKLFDTTISLIRDYDLEKRKNNFSKIFNLNKLHAKYTYANNCFSLILPLINMTISVEVLWTVFFLRAVFLSLKGRRTEESRAYEPIRKPRNLNTMPLSIFVSMPLMMLRLKLPSDIELAFELDSFHYASIPFVNDQREIKFNVFRIYGQNAHAENMWTLITIISHGLFKINSDVAVANGEERLHASCNDIRIEIPYDYIFFRTFDNLKAFFKSIKKLKSNFKNLMYIDESNKKFKTNLIMPSIVEKPFKLPSMRIKTKRVLYCNHDDPFEEQLTGFLMLGKIEQYIRLAKMKAFEKYKESMLKTLEKKYESILQFEDHVPVIPEELKKGSRGILPSFSEASNMKKSLSTGLFQHYELSNLQIDNSLVGDEVEAWLNYQRDYHKAINIPENRLRLNLSKSWISRVKKSRKIRTRSYSRNDSLNSDPKVRKEFLKRFPVVVEGSFHPLFGFTFLDVDLKLNEPSFGLNNYADFMNKVGGGIPKNMKYGIFVPMNLQLGCSSLMIRIKDYPLPMVGLGGGKDDTSLAVKFSGDLVICEQAYSLDEIRYNFVSCVPQYDITITKNNLYAFHIPRTMTNIKFVTDMHIHVDSLKPSCVSWAPSLQPGMSYAFNSFDLLSKPPLDISPKIGFWDKLPLLVPSKFTFHLKHGITLFIKAGQSPYQLIGRKAGLAFKWDNNATLKINSTGHSEDFLIVESEVFEINVPIFDPHYISDFLTHGTGAAFDHKISKTLLRLTSKPIIWKLGFVFERNLNNEKNVKPGLVERTKVFRPHYDIQLRNPETFITKEELLSWDSYEGWRSDYIYMNVSLYSRDDNKCKNIPAVPLGTAFNSFYLTPMAGHYFMYWWRSFKTSLGLPIKSGKLFENKFLSDKRSPKFSSSLFGLSYLVDLSPLYLSHIYQHPSAEKGVSKVAFTGLKCFVKSFTMDLHQSKKEVVILDEKSKTVSKEYHLKMNKGVIDFVEADLRLITAVFNQASATAMVVKELGLDRSNTIFTEGDSSSSGSEDYMDKIWYDIDDFVELESQNLPQEEPKWKVYPFASSPRFYYVRDTPSESVKYPFDVVETETHYCQLHNRDFSNVASTLAETRLNEIEDQISFIKIELNDLESKPLDAFAKKKINQLSLDLKELIHRSHILKSLKKRFSCGVFPQYDSFMDDAGQSDDEIMYELSKSNTRVSSHISKSRSKLSQKPQSTSNYRNRFIVHTINIKWTPHVKSRFLRYIEQVKDRRFLVFSLSQKALNLGKELSKLIDLEFHSDPDFSNIEKPIPEVEFEKGNNLLEKFDEILHDTTGFLESELDDSYLLKFILPQITLTTNRSKCVVLMSNQIVLRRVTVKGYEISRTDEDDLSLPMETRDGLTLNDAFVYVLKREDILNSKLKLFSPDAYLWPPKLPLEMYYTPLSLDENVVVQDLSCAMIMVKPNEYHTKRASNSSTRCKETVRIIAPDISITMNSEQYLSLYEVVSSVMKKEETEIQKVKDSVKNLVKYSDFSDFKDLYKYLAELQDQARQLRDCRRLMVNANVAESIDLITDLERINIEIEKVLLQVNAVVDIFQTAKSKNINELHEYTQWNIMTGLIKISLIDENKIPFAELSAIDALYMFTESPNGESTNIAYIFDFSLYDRDPKAQFDTVVSRLYDTNNNIFRGDWTLLPAVGGIKVIQDKKFVFAPLKVQCDMRFADSVQNFIFPDSKILKNDVFDSDDEDSEYFDLDSTNSDASSITKVNSISSQTSKLSSEKDGSKISKAFHKLLPKSMNNGKNQYESSPVPVPMSANSRVPSVTNQVRREPVEDNSCSNNIKIMEKRSATYYLMNHVEINALELSITFKGSGKFRLINLTDFKINTPVIEIKNQIISNEELFAIIRNKLVKYILRNTHNLIKSTLKRNKRSMITSKRGQRSHVKDNTISQKGKTVNGFTSALHHHSPHTFEDSDLLEPSLEKGTSQRNSNSISLRDLIEDDEGPNPAGVQASTVFLPLSEVLEEDEGQDPEQEK